MDYGKYSLKNLKSCNGRDGVAWSATLYRDGVKIGDITQSGSGGPSNIYYSVKGEEALLREHAAKQPPMEAFGMTLPIDDELFLDDLRAWTEATKRARSILKNKIAVIDGKGRGVRVYNLPYTPDNLRRLKPGDVAVDPSAPDALERVARAMIVD